MSKSYVSLQRLASQRSSEQDQCSSPTLLQKITSKLGFDSESSTDAGNKRGDPADERDNGLNHTRQDGSDSPGFFDMIKSKLGIRTGDDSDKDEPSPSHQATIEVGNYPIYPGELVSIPTVDTDTTTSKLDTGSDDDKKQDGSRRPDESPTPGNTAETDSCSKDQDTDSQQSHEPGSLLLMSTPQAEAGTIYNSSLLDSNAGGGSLYPAKSDTEVSL